jgi:hypothetical protein
MSAAYKKKKSDPELSGNLVDLVARVPRRVFLKMVNASGLTKKESRLMWSMFKELKS